MYHEIPQPIYETKLFVTIFLCNQIIFLISKYSNIFHKLTCNEQVNKTIQDKRYHITCQPIKLPKMYYQYLSCVLHIIWINFEKIAASKIRSMCITTHLVDHNSASSPSAILQPNAATTCELVASETRTTAGDGCLDETVEFFITTDGELQVTRRDALHLQVLTRIACQLQHLRKRGEHTLTAGSYAATFVGIQIGHCERFWIGVAFTFQCFYFDIVNELVERNNCNEKYRMLVTRHPRTLLTLQSKLIGE